MSDNLSAEGVEAAAQPTATKVSSAEAPWPVSRLSQNLKDWIERLGALWIEGEIAQIRFNPSNMFGELKDLQIENAISIHSWNLGGIAKDLKAGDRVLALVKPNFWPKNGKLTMQVIEMRKVGLGDLLERLERLRQQIISEGLTAESRKQPLPFLPNKIGLITGANSDAEKDVLRNTKLRWPDAEFRVINTLVQGDKAAPEIIAALQVLDADPEVDVIIIARGGGAFMDLFVFNDEALVRAVAAAKTPIISAIGHENDSPLLDLVADVRASTPTDAAKRVVPDVAEERTKLGQLLQRIELRLNSYLEGQEGLIQQLRSRPILANPFTFIDDKDEDVKRWLAVARERAGNILDREALSLGHLLQQVRSLSPQQTLERGYSVVRDASGHVLTDASKVKAKQQIKIRLAKGELSATAD